MKWRLDPRQIEVVDEEVARVLRGKQIWERFEMVMEATKHHFDGIKASIRGDHPDWDEKTVMREFVRRVHGIDLDDPEWWKTNPGCTRRNECDCY